VRHLNSIQLCAFIDDVLEGAPGDETARHLATCTICRTRYESWSHVDDSLRELFGQDADEHAMDQRLAWVEIVVAAERKGLPVPEFAELRISLPPPGPAAPPVQLFPPGRAPGIGVPMRPTVAPAPEEPAPPRQPLRRPVLQSPILQHAGTPVTPTPPPAPVASTKRMPAREPVAAAAPPPADAARAPGYARMPRPPRKGLAAFFSRPVVWLTLALVAALVGAVPLGIARFGIPEIKFGFHPVPGREADVKKAAADATTDREEGTEPPRPRGRAKHATTATDAPGAQPDASVLFDLPALEPEDGEPDPGTETPPKTSAHATGRDAAAGSGAQLCGEVRNTQGQPIEGARVYLASPARMVRTDRSGRFCIACPPGQRTIRIEAAGRATVTRTVQQGSKRLETRFTLNAVN
jgi:hypothetical protein